MRPFRSTRALAAVAFAAACESVGPAGPGPNPDLGYNPDHALVRLAPGATIATIHARYGTRTIEAIESQRIYLLDLPSGRTVDEILPALSSDPDLDAASPNAETSIPEAQGRSTMAFADPSLHQADYDDQEAVHRIRGPEAWAVSRGGGAIVAVLDTGVEESHPSLAGAVVSGGFDFVDGDSDPSDERDQVDSDEDGLVDEAFGHGTFIAGIVLSVAPDARILPVRILDSDGTGTALNVAHGIDIAVQRGARIVNMSFGMAVESEVVADMIEDASNQRGVVFIASAGNADSSTRQYPAGGTEVLAVAAVDPADRKADFSNYGSWVPVAAPGVGLVGPMPPEGYGRWSGTSFATAMASGEAAILVAVAPGAGSDDVRATIATTAVAVDDLRLHGTGRIDVAAAVDAFDGDPGGSNPGGGDPDGGDPGDGDPGNGGPGPDDPGGGSGMVVMTGIVVSVDLLTGEIQLSTDVRVRVPSDEVIVDGDLTTLAAVAVELAAGGTVEAEATVVQEPGGWRALEIAFQVTGGGNGPPPGDGSFVVVGIVSSVDLVGRAVLLTSGERILVPSDDLIAPESSFPSLAAVSLALATEASVEAEARVVDDGGSLRALEIEFRPTP